VVVPYVRGFLHPSVVPAICDQGYTPELIEVRNDPPEQNPQHYSEVIRGLLRYNDDVCIIEHDVESPPGFIDSFRDCGEPWCWHNYLFEENKLNAPGFGHTRFRGGVGAKLYDRFGPDLLRNAPWPWVDSYLNDLVKEAPELGLCAHLHDGMPVHHYSAHNR